MNSTRYRADKLRDKPTIYTAPADDLKLELPALRVWLSRIDDAVTVQRLYNGVWGTVEKY